MAHSPKSMPPSPAQTDSHAVLPKRIAASVRVYFVGLMRRVTHRGGIARIARTSNSGHEDGVALGHLSQLSQSCLNALTVIIRLC